MCVCVCESFSLSRSLSLYVCVNAYTWLCVLGSFAGVVWRGCRAWLRANPEKATLEGETERMRHVGRKRDREGESSTGRIDSGWIPSRSRAPRRGAPLFLLGATPIRSISRSVSFQRPSSDRVAIDIRTRRQIKILGRPSASSCANAANVAHGGIARDDFLGVAIVLERRGVGDRAIKLTSSQLSQRTSVRDRERNRNREKV